ncbi:hypothetical protein [Clostridium saudiense]|uniref:hypothetical protein n=1 Tax=Clostridium saudiense TaxID=1414720 RepID=UPI0018AA5E99|nr:hypothetical protein [Clostridium saudiense]
MIRKKEFKILLDKLLQKELEELRKRFRPYKRKPFLRNKVTIDLDLKCKEKNTLGYYKNTRENKRQWKYEHKIFLTKLSRKRYETYCNVINDKKWGVEYLREIIRHELIHAFVYEEFDEWEMIEGCNRDYSPIFLACLHWSGLDSPYPYTNKFKESDLYKNIEKCKNYDMVYMYLVHYIGDLERSVRKINEKLNTDSNNYKKLNISFNHYEAGMIKKSYVSCITRSKKDNNIYIQKASEMTLGIGFLVTQKDIIDNFERKFNNGSMAISHSEMAWYVIGNELKQKIIIRESS